MAITRGPRALGMGTRSGSSLDGKNRAIIWGGVHTVGNGGGNSALINLFSTEGQGERI